MARRRTAGVPHLLAALSLVLVTAGCAEADPATQETTAPTTSSSSPTGPSSEPTIAQPPDDSGVTIEVTIDNGDVSPVAKSVQAGTGELITLVVRSDAEDELHVHSEPEHEFEVQPGKQQFRFTIDRPGQVLVESHETGVAIAEITVQ